MNILLTNDDGLYAPGLRSMARALGRRWHLQVIAPAHEHSGQGHAITISEALEITAVTFPHAAAAWRVEGTPADCVKLGLSQLIKEPVDLVVSGINNGLNTGVSVFYSGTIGGAVEAALNNVAGLAISLEHSRRPDFDAVAEHACGVIEKLCPTRGSCYNLNYPDPGRTAWGSVLAARQSIQGFEELYTEEPMRDGRVAYHLSGDIDISQEPPDSDVSLIRRGAITLTPIRKDFTDPNGLQHIRNVFGNMPPPG